MKGDISLDIATLFASVIDVDKLHAEAERGINTAVHSRYGRSATWRGRRWFIPVPQPRYDALPVPRMAFAVQAHLVAAITVETIDSSRGATVVGTIGRLEKLILPISFLQAILDDHLERFEIVTRDGKHTGWSVPGFREALRLPDGFLTELSAVLRLKSVAAWLLDFGFQGKAIAPLIVGSLLGLQFHDVITPLPVGEQPLKRETVLDRLTRMYGSARAGEMFEQAAPYLKSSMSNDEAIHAIHEIHEIAGRRY